MSDFSDLLRFDPARPCPKCGSADVVVEFHANTNRKCAKMVPDTQTFNVPWEAHLHRTCRRCHFMWGETPLDVPVKDKPADGGGS